jgi:hypothetical protein
MALASRMPGEKRLTILNAEGALAPRAETSDRDGCSISAVRFYSHSLRRAVALRWSALDLDIGTLAVRESVSEGQVPAATGPLPVFSTCFRRSQAWLPTAPGLQADSNTQEAPCTSVRP